MQAISLETSTFIEEGDGDRYRQSIVEDFKKLKKAMGKAEKGLQAIAIAGGKVPDAKGLLRLADDVVNIDNNFKATKKWAMKLGMAGKTMKRQGKVGSDKVE